MSGENSNQIQQVPVNRLAGIVSPVLSIEEAHARYNRIREFAAMVLREGEDYGEIPGSGSGRNGEKRKTLLKPGAEKLNGLFGFVPTFAPITSVEDWEKGFFFYRIKCSIWYGPPADQRLVAEAIGSCNSQEKKYRYRRAERVCPKCGKPALRKGDGGPRDCVYYCFARADGCGAKFWEKDTAALAEISAQPSGLVPNPEPCELVNTIDKMALKRAYIAATLLATNASEMFTQDMDDYLAPQPEGNGHGGGATDGSEPLPGDDGSDNGDQRPESERKPAVKAPAATKQATGAPSGGEPTAPRGAVDPAQRPAGDEKPAGSAGGQNQSPRPADDLEDPEKFAEAFANACTSRLGFPRGAADALLKSTLVKFQCADVAALPLEDRHKWVIAILEGQADHLKGSIKSGAEVKAPPPVPVRAAAAAAAPAKPAAPKDLAPGNAPPMPEWAKSAKPGDAAEVLAGRGDKSSWRPTKLRSLAAADKGEWFIHVEGIAEPWPLHLVRPVAAPPAPPAEKKPGKAAKGSAKDAPAAGAHRDPAIAAAMPPVESVTEWADFAVLWDETAMDAGYSPEQSQRILNFRLMAVLKKGKENTTSIPWRQEGIAALSLRRIEPERGRIEPEPIPAAPQ